MNSDVGELGLISAIKPANFVRCVKRDRTLGVVGIAVQKLWMLNLTMPILMSILYRVVHLSRLRRFCP